LELLRPLLLALPLEEEERELRPEEETERPFELELLLEMREPEELLLFDRFEVAMVLSGI
jgi:hypothetical protein